MEDRYYQRLNIFAGYANDARTPKELYEAIEKLGPLPRQHIIVGNKRGGQEVERDFDSAQRVAEAIYGCARQVAIGLRESNPDLPPLPPTETDPFLGLQSIQDWCINAPRRTATGKFIEAVWKWVIQHPTLVLGGLVILVLGLVGLFVPSWRSWCWDAVLSRLGLSKK